MKHTLALLSLFALAGSASAAVVTNGFVQNKQINWSHLGGAVAAQSSDQAGGVASRAIDGNYSGNYNAGSVTHTNNGEANGWWRVDLGSSRPITDITLFNRTNCCGERLSNFSVQASNDINFGTTLYDSGNYGSAVGVSQNFGGVGVTAQYVRVYRNSTPVAPEAGNNAISLAEVDVLGDALFSYANLALGSTASQSSDNGATSAADSAIDGDLNPTFTSGSTTHTAVGGGTPVFWETLLAAKSNINEISLYNRGDCCPSRLSNFRLSVFDGLTEVWGQNYFETTNGGFVGDDGNLIFSVQEDTGGFIAAGDRVRIELIGGVNNTQGTDGGPDILSLREVEIYGVAIPEPSTFALFGLGGLGLLLRRRRK